MTNTHQRRQFALEVQPQHPVTPDGRYFVVHGKLGQMANPDLTPVKRSALVSELMKARAPSGQPSSPATWPRKWPPIALSIQSNEN
jgi:hypothetical protein